MIVGFLRCQEGLGEVTLLPFPVPVELGRRLVTAIGGNGIAFLSRHVPGPPPEGRFMMNFALQLLKGYHVLIFSPRLKKAYENRFPPILHDDQRALQASHIAHQFASPAGSSVPAGRCQFFDGPSGKQIGIRPCQTGFWCSDFPSD